MKHVPSKLDRAVANPEADERARITARQLVESEIRMAKDLEEMTRDYAFATLGFSNIGHYGMALGLSERRAGLLADAGKAFTIAPDLEDEVRQGRVTIEAAAALAQILSDPRFEAEADMWRTLAREKTPPALLQAVRKAIAEADAKQAVEPITLNLPSTVRDKMGRAREIIGGMDDVPSPVTNERVIEFTLDYFLDREDPDRVEPRARRKGCTVNDPSRAIPAEVKRKILQERGRKCQVHGCSNHLFLYFCHVKGHAVGGSREADNIWLGCWLHHWLYDHDLITMSGTTANPVFRNLRGEIIGMPRPPP